MTDPWAAPHASSPVTGSIRVPGSKSETNRALVLAALADGPSTLTGALRARDTELMAAALIRLGATIDSTPGSDPAVVDWTVTPGPLRGETSLDVGLAGTVMRFLPPVAALATGDVVFDGDARARERPLGPLVEALRELGVDCAGERLPLTIHGSGRVRGGTVVIDASASSQFVSGLLLAGARFDDGLTLRHDGAPLPSIPHIRMTVEMLAEHGVATTVSDADPRHCSWRILPGPLRAIDRIIEPDLSNAAPFLAAAMVTGGRVRIEDWPERTTQPGAALADLLAEMGGDVELDRTGLIVTGPDRMTGLHADLRDVGELTPVLAALCALADGPSHLTGIGHLRGHETDRLQALADMLEATGASVTVSADGLRITPGRPRSAALRSSDDHRMATAAAVLGLVIPGITVDDIATTAKTLPDFASRWADLLAEGPTG